MKRTQLSKLLYLAESYFNQYNASILRLVAKFSSLLFVDEFWCLDKIKLPWVRTSSCIFFSTPRNFSKFEIIFLLYMFRFIR